MPEVIIVNIGEGDRAYLGRLLMAINSCNPFLVVIDTYFPGEKDEEGDSLLAEGLRLIENDIIVYTINPNSGFNRSANRFRTLAADEALIQFDKVDDLVSHFTPLKKINGQVHKHVALKIIEKVNPNIKWKYEEDERVPIKFTKTLSQLRNVKVLDLDDDPTYLLEYFKDRIVILGYAGPSNENKYYTPFCNQYESGYDPDTYGVVILANILSTISGDR